MFMLNCLEGLTALAIGGAAICTGHFDPGLTAGAAVGLSAIITRFRENVESQGIDSNRLLDSMRLAVIRELDRYDDSQEMRDARVEADSAMAELLPRIAITRSTLARTSTENPNKPYPEYAAEVIVDQLATLNPIFAQPAGSANLVSAHRGFALRVIQRALQVAMENRDFAVRLTLDMTIETNRKLAEIDQKLEDVPARVVAALKASEEDRTRGLAEDMLLALAWRLDPAIDGIPQAVLELSRAVEAFVDIQNKAVAGTNLGQLVDATFRRVAQLNQQLRFDGAAEEIDHAWRELDDEEISIQARKSRIAELGVEQARLRYDAAAMTHWLVAKLGCLEEITFSSMIDMACSYRNKEADDRERLNLDVAAQLAERALALTAIAEERALAFEIIGLALSNHGARTPGAIGMQNLRAALHAFHQAEMIWTRDVDCERWALLKMFEGQAMHTIGMRLLGFAGLRILCKGIRACEDGASVYEHLPDAVRRADLQATRSAMLISMTKRVKGWKNLFYIGKAINASIDAMGIYNKFNYFEKSASVRINLAISYIMIGEVAPSMGGVGSIFIGLRNLREILDESDHVSEKLQWASVSFNYASGLVTAAKVVPDSAKNMLLDALVHYNNALTILTLQQDPVAWANIKINVARACIRVSEISSDYLHYLYRAEVAFKEALEIFSPESMPFHYADAKEGLAEVQCRISILNK